MYTKRSQACSCLADSPDPCMHSVSGLLPRLWSIASQAGSSHLIAQHEGRAAGEGVLRDGLCLIAYLDAQYLAACKPGLVVRPQPSVELSLKHQHLSPA